MSDEVKSLTGQILYPVKAEDGCYLKTPIYILSVFVASLRQYFGSPNRISSGASNYLWDPDQAVSNVWISETYHADRSVVGKRPSILVSIEQAQYPQQSLNDLFGFDPNTGLTSMFNLNESVVQFKCISENMLSSVELATELRYFISAFRNQIETAFSLDRVRAISTGKTQKTEEYKEYCCTDFVCEVKYQEHWGVVAESLKVKSVFTNLKIDETTKNLLPQQALS